MTWYVAVVVRGTFVDDTLHENRLADRLFRLVEAPDAEAAYQKALALIEDSAYDEAYTDEDGTAGDMRAMGLADLREVDAESLADGVEVYAEVLSGKPSKRVATEKEQLTVFEPAEIPEDGGEGEAADSRFRFDGTPIR